METVQGQFYAERHNLKVSQVSLDELRDETKRAIAVVYVTSGAMRNFIEGDLLLLKTRIRDMTYT